jgi:hypothetical protein
MKKTLILLAACAALALPATAQLLTTPPETAYQRAARETVLVIQGTKATALGILRDGVGRTFGTDDHQAVMGLLGTRAAKAVEYYEGMAAWMAATMAADGDTAGLAELAAITASVPACTKNQDGTVTITQPEPE